MSRKQLSPISWFDNTIRIFLASACGRELGLDWRTSNFNLSHRTSNVDENYSVECSLFYAKRALTWEMSFNAMYPELGPDLIPDEEDCLEIENAQLLGITLHALIKWKFTHNKSLLDVLHEISKIYRQYQVNMCKTHSPRLRLEYDQLSHYINPEDFEIALNIGSKQYGAKLLIRLDIDVSNSCKPHTADENIQLLIFLHGPTYVHLISELYVPNFLKNLLDDSGLLNVPSLIETQNLVNYVREVQKYIKEEIISTMNRLEQRKDFITALLVTQHAPIIECDFQRYKKISFLLRYLNFHFILNFKLSNDFPEQQFSMSLNSIYHISEQGKPICRDITKFPYSPRWTTKEKIKKAIVHVFKEEIHEFIDFPKFHKF